MKEKFIYLLKKEETMNVAFLNLLSIIEFYKLLDNIEVGSPLCQILAFSIDLQHLKINSYLGRLKEVL